MLLTNEVRIETSTLCNYKCVFCPHSSSFNRSKEIMSTEMFKFIVDKINNELNLITDITISGFGESFLDLDLLNKIKYCKEYNYKVHILSNGSLLNKKMINDLDSLNVDSIRISLHTLDYKEYKIITGANKNIFEKVLSNIDYIINNTSIKFIITFVTESIIDNESFNNIIKKYNRYKNVTIEIWKAHNWVDTFGYRKGIVEIPTCKRPITGPLQIQVDGTVNMCCFDYNGILLLGNFLTQSIKEIFNSNLYIDLKHHHLNGTLEKTNYICKNCDQLKNKDNIIIYNNKFETNDRINRTSSNYGKL